MSETLATASQQAEAAVLELHKKFLKETRPEPVLAPFNEAAIQRFEALKFPHRKHEMYTYVNTRDLVATAFSLPKGHTVDADFVKSHVYAGCEKSHLTLVDGVWDPEHSDLRALGSALKVGSLAEAAADPAVQEYLQRTIENENDVFASINSAFMKQGLVLELEPGTRLEIPFQILQVSTGSETGAVTTHPRIFMKLGKSSELKAILKTVGARGNYFINAGYDLFLEENAGLTWTQVQFDRPDAWNFSKVRASLSRNARFFAFNVLHGSKLTRHHHDIALQEEGSELRLNGVSVLKGQEQAHTFLRVHHEAPHGSSHLRFKNVVNDRGRSSVDGTVVVNQGAQQTYSDQLINNLLLSDQAHADNKPNLMIFADDVKCTHGATVGQIDEDQLFYLQTRGLSPEMARELLTKSFAQSIVQTIPFGSVVEDLNHTFLKKLEA